MINNELSKLAKTYDMTKNNNNMEWLPKDTRNKISQIWKLIPENEQDQFQSLIDKIPTQTNMWKLLVKLASDQLKMTMGNKHSVAIVGPANVGKSTLYNQFIETKDDLAEVSPIPGTTKENQEAETGIFKIIDTPGADAVGAIGEHEREMAFSAAEKADLLIVLFDAIQGIKTSEIEVFTTLTGLSKPFIVVMNKMDAVSKADQEKILENAANNLKLEKEQVIPVSAKEAKNLSKILTAVAVSEPAILAALGQALPQYRWQLAWRIIVSAASLSGVIALTPLPIIDFVPIVVNQASMVLGIARIYDYKIDFKRAKELVVAFGLGFLGRTLFYELSKLGGIPGWVLSAAIAASTTVALGYASVVWFEKGEKLSSQKLKEMTKSITSLLLNSLINLRGKKDRKKLRDKIALTLSQSDIGKELAAEEEIDEDGSEIVK